LRERPWRLEWLSSGNRQLLILLVLLLIVFRFPLGGGLFNGASLRSMGFQLPEMGILALAMMVSLLSGGVDLSTIASANLAALTIAYVVTAALPGSAGAISAPWEISAMLAGLLVALVVGMTNGFLIGYVNVSPILATLGTMSRVKGLAILGPRHSGRCDGSGRRWGRASQDRRNARRPAHSHQQRSRQRRPPALAEPFTYRGL
jgi:ribose/xylose/arabinose/galactoside ABC-type transport system permease subunit